VSATRHEEPSCTQPSAASHADASRLDAHRSTQPPSDEEQYRPSESQDGTHSQAAFLFAQFFVTGGAGELEPPPLDTEPNISVDPPLT